MGPAESGSGKRVWQEKIRTTKERVLERMRVTCTSQRLLRQSQRQLGVSWRATATSLGVARVFHGNIVLARMARSMARNEWKKRIGLWMDRVPRFRSLASSVTAGSVALISPVPALGEPLAVSDVSHEMDMGRTSYQSSHNYKVSLTLGGEPVCVQEGSVAEDSLLLRMMQKVAVPLIGNACHLYMHGLNFTEVYGAEKMQEAVFNRERRQGLVTVSNHMAAVDDPFVISSILPPHMLMNANKLRWTLCATDRCFTSAAAAAFFRSVKVLPLTRGLGVYQDGMEVALKKLNKGEWVHIFPEGSRSRDGNLGLVKRGVGRLVLDADNPPLLIPFIHSGMQGIMPIGQHYPSIQQKIIVLVGDPINVDDLIKQAEEGVPKAVLYDAIALRVRDTIWSMRFELDKLVAGNISTVSQSQDVQLIKKVHGIWQYVDWEAQGFGFDNLDSSIKNSVDDLGSSSEIEPAVEQGTTTRSCAFDRDLHQLPRLSPTNVAAAGCSCHSDVNLEAIMIDVPFHTVGIHGHMDPSMYMGFAARAFLNSRQNLEDSRKFFRWRHWRTICWAS